jgi:predicted phage tail protein
MSRHIDNTTTEIILGGTLGERYGQSHHYVARTPVEAFRMLCLNFPDFRQQIQEESLAGAEYQFVVDDKRCVTADELHLPIGGKRMMFCNAVEGSGGKLFGAIETVIGVIIIAAAEYFSWGSATPFLVGLGASLVVGGITSLLTTLPKNTGAGGGDSLSSFYFNGASNTQQQGAPVPVIYGRVLVGSQAVSASMSAVDLASAPAETGNLS